MTQIGIGLRSEMFDWPPAAIDADFFEVSPENWIRRDRTPLYRLRDSGRAVQLHGVSLNLGGSSRPNRRFLRELRGLIDDIGPCHYSDHLAASGDAYQLYDLFPVPFTETEVVRINDRIREIQDVLGQRIGIENTTYYTNIGELSEPAFLCRVAERADCNILLDFNNISVNQKNHGTDNIADFIAQLPAGRVSYIHVAGHEFDDRFGLYIDTHSQSVEPDTARAAGAWGGCHGKDILLEWDNDIPDLATINRELACLRTFSTT